MGDGRESSSWGVSGELEVLGAFEAAGSQLGRRLQGVGVGEL